MDSPAKPDLDKLKGLGAGIASDFVKIAVSETDEIEEKEKIKSILSDFFKELTKTGSEFGYRSAAEIFRFCSVLKSLQGQDNGKWEIFDIVDAAVMQKLLPKIHGSRKKLEMILTSLAKLCLNDGVENIDDLLNKFEESPELIEEDARVRFKLSLEKTLRMRKRSVQDGFTSFAEA